LPTFIDVEFSAIFSIQAYSTYVKSWKKTLIFPKSQTLEVDENFDRSAEAAFR
jgi:hypothetical protein